MDYHVFINSLLEYYQLYERGLKKQANKYIQDYVISLSQWDKDKLRDVLFHFTKELCDEQGYDFCKRGNGRIPYALDVFLRDYLYSECLENKMPQLRWFYELYKNDKFGVNYARNMLEKAYLSEKCDTKTVELFFYMWIEILAWGSHHFPNGCLITKEAMENAVKQCKNIISEKDVNEKFRKQLEYFETLYICYYQFEEDNRTKTFEDYCHQADIEFICNNAYYYNY